MEGLLITSTHSSNYLTPEVESRMVLAPEYRVLACDTGTGEVALEAARALSNNPENMVRLANVGRLVVDLNRNETDVGADGVCRTIDLSKRTVYHKGMEPTPEEREQRLRQYYRPWHEDLLRILSQPDLRLHIDLHNTSHAAFKNPPGVKFGDICDVDIGVRSNWNSVEPIDPEGLSFPGNEVEGVIEAFRRHMGTFFEDCLQRDRGEVKVRVSGYYRGGAYMVKRSRNVGNWKAGVPRALQVEIKREYFTDERKAPDKEKIAALSRVIRNTVLDIY